MPKKLHEQYKKSENKVEAKPKKYNIYLDEEELEEIKN
jgi:hypothetical protein